MALAGLRRCGLGLLSITVILVLAASVAGASGKLLQGEIVPADTTPDENIVRHKCLTPQGNEQKLGVLRRPNPWSLPLESLAADFDTTIHCLVLRYNFQYEETDNVNTTGRGRMDISRPLDTLTDEQYIARVGHIIDPPPHDSVYFDAHLKALSRYWEQVSEGQIHLVWDIYPPYRDSVYELPQPMTYYGRCEMSEVVYGLEDYFVDCMQLADTAHLLHPGEEARWDIDFSQYDALFLFHAGSDRQNDIGFPTTCSDLFSGFIRFSGTVAVDDSTVEINTGLMMPESSVQDNRVTALNAVMAHEFGHQLGLIDIYNTANFFSQIGDFGLMDNNGFGSGIDFGFPAGRVFGAIPLYPSAWSRAFLGLVEVEDFRGDTNDVRLAAAGMYQDTILKIARVPITETEYYLVENRSIDVDGLPTALLADSVTSVIQGPVTFEKEFTGEYDFLMPGSGMLIYLIDEEVASLDYDGDGQNNFWDNDLQWYLASEERKFIKLIEADGLTGFGGYFRSGFGNAEDMFRDDRNNSFTPNTNPPALDNTGNNTHIYMTDIRRDTIRGVSQTTYDDRYMTFDLERDRKVDGFPVRMGAPSLGLSPIADDLDGDGVAEVIVASGNLLSVVTSTGEDFIRSLETCDTLTCPLYYDTAAGMLDSIVPTSPVSTYPVPVYAEMPADIWCGPVTGTFASLPDTNLVAVGYPNGSNGFVAVFKPTDGDADARADLAGTALSTLGAPIALSFGEGVLYTLTTRGYVYRQDSLAVYADRFQVPGDAFQGISRLGDDLVVVANDTTTLETYLTVVADTVYTLTLDGLYLFGPLVIDIDRNGQPEVVAFSVEGEGVMVTVDTTATAPSFSILSERETGVLVSANPVAGDVDDDGYPDIIAGGLGRLHAFGPDFITKTDFPIELDDRYPNGFVIAAPVVADIQRGGVDEMVFPTSVGNVYSFGPDETFGFPLSSGEQKAGSSGSPAVVFHDATGGKLGYLGGDGWFYAWEVDVDSTALWPMNGGDPSGSFSLSTERLVAPKTHAGGFDEERFYNYPNPVREGTTRIRYFLGEEANSVVLNIYDLSGTEIAELTGTTTGGSDNELVWDCGDVTPGVYRCVIEIDFGGDTETAFTDIAILN